MIREFKVQLNMSRQKVTGLMYAKVFAGEAESEVECEADNGVKLDFFMLCLWKVDLFGCS